MKRKEPYATKEEIAKKVLHVGRGSVVDLGSHGEANLLLGEKIMLSFVDMPANSYAEPHSHPDNEQIMMLLKGDADFVVDGKIYPVVEGDVVVLLPGVEHAAYVGPNGARVLDVFSPPRADLLAMMK
jgi:quercetin dioxygenase-like cupin family protein